MTETEQIKGQWERFHRHRDERTREELILFYLPLVGEVMRSFRNVRPQDRPDLEQAGTVGLIESVDKWDRAKMAWLPFAKFRIRAAMIDHIRAVSWVPKSVRSEARVLEGAEERIAARVGRMPTTDELAEELGCSVEDVEEMLTTVRGTDWSVASLDHTPDGEGDWLEVLADPDGETPEATAVRREDLDALELVIQRLPGRQRDILKWRFFQYPVKSQKEIAEELGVHESRISQLLDAAFLQARKLAQQPDVLFPEVYSEGGRITCRD